MTGNLASWGYRPSFHDRLSSWLAFWNANTPSGYADASRVWGYGWGLGTAVDGVWGSQTAIHSTRVLRAGVATGGLRTSQSRWLAFNRASMRTGYGTQTYRAP